MTQNKNLAQATDPPRAPPEHDCTDCRYLIGRRHVCGVCIRKILADQKGATC